MKILLTPPKGAYALVYFLSLIFCGGLTSLTYSSLIAGSKEILESEYYLSFSMGGLLAIFFTIWFIKRQRIELCDDNVFFSYTRYCIPKVRVAVHKDIRTIVFHDGIFGNDGKPRPYVYLERLDGTNFWVPLPIYGRRDLGLMLEYFRKKNLPLRIQGDVKFVTGKHKEK